MTAPPATTRPAILAPAPRVWAVGAGLGGAVALRVGLAGPAGARSAPAGLVFAVVLVALALAAVPRVLPAVGRTARQLAMGLAGASVLCLVPLLVHLRTPGASLPSAELPMWAGVVTVVAVAEEVLLRGALWHVASEAAGTTAALVVTTAAFGLLHVPLYGWSALPLDLAVGLLLGGLRMAAGGWGAPAAAHVVADLAGWWLR